MCGRHPVGKGFWARLLRLAMRGYGHVFGLWGGAGATRLRAPPVGLAMMLSADEVPIIPTGSKPDDSVGLSSFACPCSLGSAFTPVAPSPHIRSAVGSPPVPRIPHCKAICDAAGNAGKWLAI